MLGPASHKCGALDKFCEGLVIEELRVRSLHAIEGRSNFLIRKITALVTGPPDGVLPVLRECFSAINKQQTWYDGYEAKPSSTHLATTSGQWTLLTSPTRTASLLPARTNRTWTCVHTSHWMYMTRYYGHTESQSGDGRIERRMLRSMGIATDSRPNVQPRMGTATSGTPEPTRMTS